MNGERITKVYSQEGVVATNTGGSKEVTIHCVVWRMVCIIVDGPGDFVQGYIPGDQGESCRKKTLVSYDRITLFYI